MKLKKNEGRVYFSFDGVDYDPNEITKILNIEPTNIRYKGEFPSGKLPKETSWILSTQNIVDEYIDIYQMATSITKILKPKINLINKIREQFNVTTRLEVVLWFSVDENSSTPAIGFEIETIEFLGKVGAFIDIDTYLNPCEEV